MRPSRHSRRYVGGGPLRRYARLVGAPNSAPSLRSVAGLLLALALESAYEDTLTSPHRSVTAAAPSRRVCALVPFEPRSVPPETPASRASLGALPRVMAVAPAQSDGEDRTIESERAERRDSDDWHHDRPRGKAERVPVGGFAKRARGGDPRLSGAKERSWGLRVPAKRKRAGGESERSRRREPSPPYRLRRQARWTETSHCAGSRI